MEPKPNRTQPNSYTAHYVMMENSSFFSWGRYGMEVAVCGMEDGEVEVVEGEMGK